MVFYEHVSSFVYSTGDGHGHEVQLRIPMRDIKCAQSKETRQIQNKPKDKTQTKGTKARNPRTPLQTRSGIRCSGRVSIP